MPRSARISTSSRSCSVSSSSLRLVKTPAMLLDSSFDDRDRPSFSRWNQLGRGAGCDVLSGSAAFCSTFLATVTLPAGRTRRAMQAARRSAPEFQAVPGLAARPARAGTALPAVRARVSWQARPEPPAAPAPAFPRACSERARAPGLPRSRLDFGRRRCRLGLGRHGLFGRRGRRRFRRARRLDRHRLRDGLRSGVAGSAAVLRVSRSSAPKSSGGSASVSAGGASASWRPKENTFLMKPNAIAAIRP